MGKRSCIYLAVGLLLSVRPAFAHHAFSAEFDQNNPIRLDGTITRVEWTNPHVFVFMDVRDANGKATNWKVEFGNREALDEQGWTHLGLTTGAEVTVHGWKAKDGSPLANADSITREGGIRLWAASWALMSQPYSVRCGTSRSRLASCDSTRYRFMVPNQQDAMVVPSRRGPAAVPL